MVDVVSSGGGIASAVSGYWDMSPSFPACSISMSGVIAPALGMTAFPSIVGSAVSAGGGANYIAATTTASLFSDTRVIEIEITRLDSGALANTGFASPDFTKSVIVGYDPDTSGGSWLVFVHGAGPTLHAGDGTERAAISINGATGDFQVYLNGVSVQSGTGFDPATYLIGIGWNGALSAPTDFFGARVITSISDMAYTYGSAKDICGSSGSTELPANFSAGQIYEVSVSGSYGGISFNVGDLAAVRLDGTTIGKISVTS